MTLLDWIVLGSTLALIVGYGTWKTRVNRNLNDYLKGGSSANWATIGLSVMATQASAITFLSTPGQAFESGMGFVQFYFGLPVAMVILCVWVIPRYYKLNVYTAYEFLENRFNLNTRLLAAFLFLVQRGLAAGITIYAPAIILSTLLGWNLNLTNLSVGILVIIYTVTGGTRAVSVTQKWQMAVIMSGMFIAFGIILNEIAPFASFTESLALAGAQGRMEIVNFDLDFENRYTIWSGLTGGLFLALSYFGTDQSQVQRYLSGKSIRESRLGLIFNGILKVPMQFFILLCGVMVFVFYQFHAQPIHFNENQIQMVENSELSEKGKEVVAGFNQVQADKLEVSKQFLEAERAGLPADAYKEELKQLSEQEKVYKAEYQKLIVQSNPEVSEKDAEDSDYVFLTFLLDFMPKGLVGLLLAVILSAAMSSTASELNALGSTTTIDFYKRLRGGKEQSDETQVRMGRFFTIFWGFLAIAFAVFASKLDNLIEAVNILGSLFYGTILGIFVVGFFIKFIRARAIFIGAIISESLVLLIYFLEWKDLGFLWYNVIGCLLTLVIAMLLQVLIGKGK